jgi:hypothetical protein
MLPVDLRGLRSGGMTDIAPTGERSSSQEVVWRCRCDCGAEILVVAGSLRQKKSRSCGCSRRGLRDPARAMEMATLQEAGWSLAEIGKKYGLSRERVRQILNPPH